MRKMFNHLTILLQYMDRNQKYMLLCFLFLLGSVTISYWKKYEMNPTAMVNFGREFAHLNEKETPKNAIVFLGEENDLGAGYDGQIFYYFSRSLSNFSLDWPKGFDESYRAPRIGYPFLIFTFGLLGSYGAVFGMYFWNIALIIISYYALRSLLAPNNRYLSALYLFNPFALGSYYVLVSDSVMVSLVVIAYYLFQNGKYVGFILLSSLAILTKEPAIFFLFPLGLRELFRKDLRKALLVAMTLILPIFWHSYLSYRFPNWSATRLTDFILPFEGMISYAESIFFSLHEEQSLKDIARLLSRLPLIVLFFMGSFLVFTGRVSKGWEFRIGILLTMFMIGTGGFYHFWSVYENVSRMFTISIPLLILLINDDESVASREYILLTIGLLFLFLLKVFVISKTLHYQIGI